MNSDTKFNQQPLLKHKSEDGDGARAGTASPFDPPREPRAAGGPCDGVLVGYGALLFSAAAVLVMNTPTDKKDAP